MYGQLEMWRRPRVSYVPEDDPKSSLECSLGSSRGHHHGQWWSDQNCGMDLSDGIQWLSHAVLWESGASVRTRQDQDSQAEPPTCWHHIIESRDPKIKKRRLQPVAVLERRGRRKTFAVLGIPKDELIIQKKMILPQQSLRYHNGKNKKLLAAVKWGLGRCRGFFLAVLFCTSV